MHQVTYKMIIDDNFLSDESKQFIENYVLSRHFPLYMQGESVKGDETPFLNHVILPRPELRDVKTKHAYYDDFIKILNEFCDKNKIHYDEVLRVCVNFTFYNGVRDVSPTHVDHDFDYNQLIVYLNDPLDVMSSTVLLDKENTNILPKQYRGLSFGKIEHYHYYPKKGGRYVLVFTYR